MMFVSHMYYVLFLSGDGMFIIASYSVCILISPTGIHHLKSRDCDMALSVSHPECLCAVVCVAVCRASVPI